MEKIVKRFKTIFKDLPETEKVREKREKYEYLITQCYYSLDYEIFRIFFFLNCGEEAKFGDFVENLKNETKKRKMEILAEFDEILDLYIHAELPQIKSEFSFSNEQIPLQRLMRISPDLEDAIVINALCIALIWARRQRKNPENYDFSEIYNLIERYYFIKYTLGEPLDKNEQKEYQKIAKIGETRAKLAKFAHEIYKSETKFALDKKIAEFKRFLRLSKSEISKYLENYVDKVHKKEQDFREKLNSSEKWRHEWFYWFYSTQYILLEYEIWLCEKRFNNDELARLIPVIDQNKSIEHIWPQNKAQELGENKHLTHSIGNLMIISRNQNSALGNKAFSEKRKRYKNANFQAKLVAKNRVWNAKKINERTDEILDFMELRWKFKFSDAQKKTLKGKNFC